MGDPSRFTIMCPCCEATISIDAQTGAIQSGSSKKEALATSGAVHNS